MAQNEKLEFDVVILGTGVAGLCAALEACAAGAKVAVLEKTASPGGASRTAGGMFAIPNAQSATGKQDYIDDFLYKSGGRGTVDTFKAMADRSIDDVAWLASLGVRFTPVEPVAPYRVCGVFAYPGHAQGMPEAIDTLCKRVAERGGHIFFNVKAKDVLLDKAQKVCGVGATGPDGAAMQFDSRAVVLTTGGYSASPEILAEHVGPNARQLVVRGAAACTGDGLQMALRHGAATVNLDGLSSIHVAAVSARDVVNGNPFQGLPFCISVNSEGKRFVDESQGYVAHGKAALNQKGQRVALLFGDGHRKEPLVETSAGLFRRIGSGVVEADSIDELARRIEVPADALADTIRAFNDAVSGDAAPTAVPPKRAFARRVEGPKYYAFFPLVPGVTLSFGGLATNASAQVLRQDGSAIPGLYAAGEITGGEFFDDYVGGGSLTKCLVMGRIAGRAAASR